MPRLRAQCFERVEQRLAESAALPGILDDDAELGAAAVRIARVARHAADRRRLGFRGSIASDRDEGHLAVVVDLGEAHQALERQLLDRRVEAQVHRLGDRRAMKRRSASPSSGRIGRSRSSLPSRKRTGCSRPRGYGWIARCPKRASGASAPSSTTTRASSTVTPLLVGEQRIDVELAHARQLAGEIRQAQQHVE